MSRSSVLWRACAFLCATACPYAYGQGLSKAHPWTVSLPNLVGPDSHLRVQELRFDASHAALAVDHLGTGNKDRMAEMAASPAIEHLLRHARKFDQDVPKESAAALAADLVAPKALRLDSVGVCAQSLAYFQGPMQSDPAWVGDILRYLPEGFRFHATLFLTFNYDIGVAEGSTASLNGANHSFRTHPRELVYYAIHELHHVGFMTYHPAVPLAELRTFGDLRHWVEFATQLEGMAVWTAYPRRKSEGALAQDGMGDYMALLDEPRMRDLEQRFLEAFAALKTKGERRLEAGDLDAVLGTFARDRLWYRIGAHMARRIEERLGRKALVSLVQAGPSAYFETYFKISQP